MRYINRLILFCLIGIFSVSEVQTAESQKSSTIKGYIYDAESGEALPYANIQLIGTNRGTTSNTDGYFVLVNVAVDTCSLLIQYMGYKSQILNFVNTSEGLPALRVKLKPTVIELEGITVTANADMLEAGKEISKISLSPKQLASMPSLGEVDVFRSLQLLPGISGVSDGSSGLYVRGGTPDQNLILFDGMTIYHVDHFFGFFSAFNADAIKDIQMYKGGFPAEFGGRTSSVVNLTGKTGARNKRQFGYGLNLLSGHASLELPLSTWGSFIFAGRRSYTDFIRSPLYDSIYELMTGEENGGAIGNPVRPGGGIGGGRFGGNQMQAEFKPSFYFYDVNSKLTLNPTSRDILSFSFYSGKDNLDKSQDFSDFSFRMRDDGSDATLQTTDYTRWGNLGMSGKLSRQWSDRVYVNLLAAHSKYFSEYDRSNQLTGIATPTQMDSTRVRRNFNNASKEENEVKDTSYKLDVDWQAFKSHRFDFGAHVTQFNNNYSATMNDTLSLLNTETSSTLYAIYLQDKYNIGKLDVTLGLRGSHYDKTSQLYYEPRAAMDYSLTGNITLRGAWGHYYQFVNRIANENVTQGARDFWMLANDKINPGFAEHRILGLSYENNNYILNVEAYTKDLDNVVEFTRRYRGRMERETYFYTGTGDIKGIEFLAQKKRGKLTGWVGYTLGRVNYQFPELYNGEVIPADHDRRHEVNIVAKYTHGVYTLAATWVFASGNPYTSPESQYYIPLLDGETNSYIHVSDKNANRLPDYHRLDLSASRLFESNSWKTEIGVSVFNVYNHKNVWYKDYNLDTVPVTVTDVLMLGFTPTIYIQMNLK